jgi:glycosyltransferase involved in cell wall biosynthesis
MDWYPNEDAVVHFADDVLPLIQRTRPDVTFSIVGRRPGVRVLELATRQGIEVTGTVDDVRPHVRAGAVQIVPLRIGGGTRLKIFEALAMGQAVVSTTIGAEGLDVEPHRHIELADDPAAMSSIVLALLNDPARRHALGDAGRELVESRYGWAQVAREFGAELSAVVTRKFSPNPNPGTPEPRNSGTTVEVLS